MPKKWDAEVWGPHYWFFLHSVAHTYPEVPNAVTKRKYYDLIQNMPLFLPDAEMGNRFSALLDAFPVSPYLDSRDSFIHWVHFMHNRVRRSLGQDELTLAEGIDAFMDHFKPKEVKIVDQWRLREHWITAAMIVVCCGAIFILSKL
jgi:hypothetical protein